MSKTKKAVSNCGELLSENILENYSAGSGSGFNDLTGLKVKCSVAGCCFECDTFSELNLHMKNSHPEYC